MTIKNAITSKLNTCPKCQFTALFMYKDVTGPICPKCEKETIDEYKSLMADINNGLFIDELECENELDSEEIEELNF